MAVMPHNSAIDGLRAIAVMAVILHHFYPDALPSGFLGVDAFFVVSGYVIALHLRSMSTDNGTSWGEYLLGFYARRMKRLLPGLLFCVVITCMLLPLLTSKPSMDVLNTGTAALIGASNLLLLANTADYFSLETQLNPFTQTWSLGVEEQFYVLFPCILALTGFTKTKRPRGPQCASSVLVLRRQLFLPFSDN